MILDTETTRATWHTYNNRRSPVHALQGGRSLCGWAILKGLEILPDETPITCGNCARILPSLDWVPRFLSHIQKAEDSGGCWEWTGRLNVHGYGAWKLRTLNGRQTLGAYRVAYQLFVGAVPDGLHLDHLCRNRVCVNPAHLEPVTPAENYRRSPIMMSKQNAAKTHCKHGHEFAGQNLRIETTRVGGQHRVCLTCKRLRGLLRYRSNYKTVGSERRNG